MGGCDFLFFRKTLNSFSFHFRFYAVFNNNIFFCAEILKSAPSDTYWLNILNKNTFKPNGRWFLQIVDGQWEFISNILLF